jgi:hypothetical protein
MALAYLLTTKGTQGVANALVVELNLHSALLPLLQATNNAAPLATTLRGERTLVVGRRMRLQAEDLYTRTCGLVHNDSGTDNAGIVEDKHSTLRQLRANLRKAGVRHLATSPAEQLGTVALSKRVLGYSLIRQRIIKIIYINMSFHHNIQFEIINYLLITLVS